MNYAAIDPILNRWAQKQGLTILTAYRDEEVRSIELVDKKGRRYQVWIDPPDATGTTTVHAWDYKKQRMDDAVRPTDLEACLDKVHAAVRTWMSTP
jgi:hypothetical protein